VNSNASAHLSRCAQRHTPTTSTPGGFTAQLRSGTRNEGAVKVRSCPDAADEDFGLERRADAATLVVVVQVSPARLNWLVALAEGDAVFSSRFGIAVEPGWAGFPEALPAAVAAARQRLEGPWGTYLFFDDDGALVGIGGFKGPPTEGVVEIGYAVSPSRQGRGIATAAVHYFLAQAAREGVATVIAHTLAGVNPSTRVLTKTGFVRTTTQDDPEVGAVWRWERSFG
jgi:ribosomal-protein-alanine N-acetyltransferase